METFKDIMFILLGILLVLFGLTLLSFSILATVIICDWIVFEFTGASNTVFMNDGMEGWIAFAFIWEFLFIGTSTGVTKCLEAKVDEKRSKKTDDSKEIGEAYEGAKQGLKNYGFDTDESGLK